MANGNGFVFHFISFEQAQIAIFEGLNEDEALNVRTFGMNLNL